MGKSCTRFAFVEMGQKPFLILTYYHKKTDKLSLCAARFDKDWTIDPNLVLLDEITGDGKRNKGVFNFQVSEDRQQLVVYAENAWEKGKLLNMAVKVFDKDLNKLQAKEYQLPYNGELCDVGQKMVLTKNMLYMLATNVEPLDMADSKVLGNRILCINLKDGLMKEVNIDLEGKFLFDVTMKSDEQGNLVCGGLYSIEKPKDYKLFFYGSGYRFASGAFCYLVNSDTFTIEQKQLIDLEAELKENKYNYYLKDLIVLNNGNIFMVSEQYRYVTIRSGSGNNKTSYTTYYYEDILINHFDLKANTSWSRKISKSQSRYEYGTLFYSYMPLYDKNKDELSLIMNADAERLPDVSSGKGIYLEDFKKIKFGCTVRFKINGNQHASLEKLKTGETEYLVECRNAYVVNGRLLLNRCVNRADREAFGRIGIP